MACLTCGQKDNGLLLACSKCLVQVHARCYGVETEGLQSADWLCSPCSAGIATAQTKCCMCPKLGGALKRVVNNRNTWIHVICALMLPRITFRDNTRMEPVSIEQQLKTRGREVKPCYICCQNDQKKQANFGATVLCPGEHCTNWFHATCAHADGILFQHDSEKLNFSGACAAHIFGVFQKACLISPAKRMPRLDLDLLFPAPKIDSKEPKSVRYKRNPVFVKTALVSEELAEKFRFAVQLQNCSAVCNILDSQSPEVRSTLINAEHAFVLAGKTVVCASLVFLILVGDELISSVFLNDANYCDTVCYETPFTTTFDNSRIWMNSLRAAIYKDNVNLVTVLVDKMKSGMESVCPKDGMTPLLFACRFAKPKSVSCLLSKGADISAVSSLGNAVQLSCASGSLQTVIALFAVTSRDNKALSLAKLPNIGNNNNNSESPLEIAAGISEQMTEYLLENGAPVTERAFSNALAANKPGILMLLSKWLDAKDISSVFLYCKFNLYGSLKAVLDQGFLDFVQRRNEHGESALIVAIKHDSYEALAVLLNHLRACGKLGQMLCDTTRDVQQSAATFALETGRFSCFQLLISDLL